MNCDCGRPLEPHIVNVDGEQYVENLCPRCAFPVTLGPELGPLISDSKMLARVGSSGRIIQVERFQLERDFSRGVTASLTTYGGVTASFTPHGMTAIDPNDKLDIEVNGVDIGTFHITSIRTTPHREQDGTFRVRTEVELIGAK